MLFKFLKFGIVGITGMVIDFSITFLLKEKLKVHRYVASSTGFVSAATFNYFLNRIWTFYSSDPNILVQYGKYLIISVIGLGINNLFLFLFEKKFPFYGSKLIATGVTMTWNFFANYYITFLP